VASVLRRVQPFRRSFEEVEQYAAAWQAHNDAASAADGPLWVVLGDSAAQGVGASAYDRGWVGLVHDTQLGGTAWSTCHGQERAHATRSTSVACGPAAAP
jgi:hypothetical protein